VHRASRCSRRRSTTARPGDNVGILLRGIEKEQIERGMVLAAPKSITPHTDVRVDRLHPHEGRGRPAHALHQGLPPAVLLPHHRRDGAVTEIKGAEMVLPGDNVTMNVELISQIAMEEGVRFAIREGGRTVGAGRVTKVLK
jgi:elongation factor Tu